MIENNLIYNGAIARESDLPVGLLTNRAFLYGDGLFETLIYRRGEVRYLLGFIRGVDLARGSRVSHGEVAARFGKVTIQ